MLKKFLWLIPFICFIGGYGVAHLLFRAETLQTPNVVGLSLASAVDTLSDYGIGVRITARKPSNDATEGTVLMQSPLAGQTIKKHQTAFLVIAEQPPVPTTPSFLTLSREEIEQEAAKLHVKVHYYTVPNPAPVGTCCAQNPAPGTPQTTPDILVYCAEPLSSLVIWPSFIGKTIGEVIPWLEAHNIRHEITAAKAYYSDRTKLLQAPIVDQHPRPGTVVRTDATSFPNVILHLP